jgi:FkbH-like protein
VRLSEALALVRNNTPGETSVPISLVCGFTPQPLVSFLAAHLQKRLSGVRVDISTGQFGDIVGNLERYLHAPCGTAALVLEWEDLDSRLGWRRLGGWGRGRVADICEVVERQLGAIRTLLVDNANAGVIAISLPTVPPAPVEPVPSREYGHLQRRLDALLSSFASDLFSCSQIRFVSPDRLAELSPQHQRLDAKAMVQAGFPYRLTHADALASLLAEVLQPQGPLKGIITDLDGTLWSGILGEIGVEGVAWDLENHAVQHGVYQQMLQSLADSGVLVAVASKNDRALVRSALERPDILLRCDSVFPIEAYWGPKSASVANILNAWNVSADSVLFIDDSALELAEVSAAHPRLNCREFCADPSQVHRLLTDLVDLFGKSFDTPEDSLRLKSLRAGAELRDISAETGSVEQVLASADGMLRILPIADPPNPRALELLNKTNQFNLNGRRYSDGEWSRYLRGADSLAWAASYTDRFGALGTISVLAGRFVEPNELELDTWVLSCRAFARRIEYALLDALFQRHSLHRLRFHFQATERNGPIQELLSRLTGAPPVGPVTIDAAEFEQRKLTSFMGVE